MEHIDFDAIRCFDDTPARDLCYKRGIDCDAMDRRFETAMKKLPRARQMQFCNMVWAIMEETLHGKLGEQIVRDGYMLEDFELLTVLRKAKQVFPEEVFTKNKKKKTRRGGKKKKRRILVVKK